MAYHILYPEEVTEEMVLEMARKIDPVCYPGLKIDPRHELELFRANRLSRIALMDDGDLIGHVCLFPISDRAYRRITEDGGSFLTWFDPADIPAYEPGGRYRLLVDSFAILPAYQELAACQRLIDAVFAFMASLARGGISIDEIVAFVVNPGLLPLLKRANFQSAGTTKDNIPVYTCKTADRRDAKDAAVRKGIGEAIRLIADYLDIDPETVNGDTSFRRDLDLKSLDMIRLISRAEDQLGIVIPDSEYGRLEKVKDLASLL